MGEFAYASFRYLKDNVLKEMPRGGFGLFRVCLVSMCVLQHRLYLRVLLFIKGKEGQRGELQVTRGMSRGKNF